MHYIVRITRGSDVTYWAEGMLCSYRYMATKFVDVETARHFACDTRSKVGRDAHIDLVEVHDAH